MKKPESQMKHLHKNTALGLMTKLELNRYKKIKSSVAL